VEAAGIEPASEIDVNDLSASACEKQAAPRALQMRCTAATLIVSVWPQSPLILREVVLAWSVLPVSVKQAILVLNRNCGDQQ